jgi:phage major head subunit gpT-like protein
MALTGDFTKSLQSSDIIPMIVQGLDLPGDAWIDQLAMRVDSDKDSEKYVWLGTAPQLREWKGGRQPKTLREINFSIANKDFEATLEIPTDWLRRDKHSMILMRINQLIESARAHDAELLSTLINGADSALCYDGQYFFDTDHSEDESGIQSNKITGAAATGAAPTAAEMEGAILDLTQQLLGFKDDVGRPTNASAKRFLLMVPVAYMKAASAALGTTVIIEGGASRNNLIPTMGSVNGFTYELVVNPRLTWADRFAMFRQDAILKPFVKQVEVDTTVDALAEGSEEEFKNKRHLYGVNRTMNFGANDWKGAGMYVFT